MKALAISVFAAAFVVTACSPKPAPTEAESQSAVAESAAVSMAASEAASKAVAGAMDLSGFVGKWIGPEGTSLTITPSGPDYRVTVQNLDGPRDFTGSATDAGIRFVRDGTPFILHKGDGGATGMKWLADKKDCVIVAAGEGYCRD